MKSTVYIRAALLSRMWTYGIDLKDPYFHIPMHTKSRRLQQVSFNGQIYQFRALPLCLSSVPWHFIVVAREYASLIHSLNIQFLNDSLGWAMPKEQCAKHSSLALLLCEE